MADGARTFSISLTTPDGAVFEDEAEMVIVPGAAGEIGVLARHAPLIALLRAGSTRVYKRRAAEEVQEFATGPGQRAELSRHTLAAGALTGGRGDPPMHEPGSRETALIERAMSSASPITREDLIPGAGSSS